MAVNWAGGGSAAASYGSPIYLAIAALVLATILLINRFMRGFWVNISVLIGMALGYGLCGMIGMVDLSGLAQAPWVQVVTPLHFGLPKFELAPILSMCLVVVIIFVESTGMFLALGKITGQDVTPKMLRRGLLCDAGASFFAGFFNTFTHSSFAQNIGLVQMTGVRCRSVTIMAGAFLIVLSLLPKAAFLVASIPPAVLGCGDCHVRHGRGDRHQDPAGSRHRRPPQPVAGGGEYRHGPDPGGAPGFLRATAAVDEPDNPQRDCHGHPQRVVAECTVQHSRRR